MKILLISVLAVGMIGFMVPSVFAEENVPDWVKNTAGWWASDAISETEFVNAVEYLINDGIIQVLSTASGEKSQNVPDWVKNTAGWWASDAISETEFVNAVEYLIELGIISVNSTLDNFLNSNSWDTFDFGDYGIGVNPEGYRGLTYDGKYIYFAPYYNGAGRHGEVIRYDTTSDFSSPNSWSTFDVKTDGLIPFAKGYQGAIYAGNYVFFVPFNDGKNYHSLFLLYDTRGDFSSSTSWHIIDTETAGGYEDAVFDGKYVYFVPHRNESGFHSEVIRYDTTSDLFSADSWGTFDASANGIGTNANGYVGAEFDGKYIYFAPFQNDVEAHGEVLRYDTTSDFSSPNSWGTFDASANGIGTNAKGGYEDAVFDGKYIYFTPTGTGVPHGEVLRYDTTSNFYSPNSWSTFDASANGIGTNANGYVGAEFDGKYIYFAPFHNGVEAHGEVLRYDTTSNFSSPNSWSTFDASANGVGTNAKGYWGLELIGKYIYFAPFHNGVDFHSEVLRYDTTSDFSSPNSWSTFDVSNSINDDPDGYTGATFDGKYIYFSPLNNGSFFHGEVLRYDTTSNFSSPNSWSTFDASANGVGTGANGYMGVEFDGKYIYFAPYFNNSGEHGEVLRYDTTSDFSSPNSWSTFDTSANGVGTNANGYAGAEFDGKYIYFAPYFNNSGEHCEVLRYDTTSDFSSPNSWSTFDTSANGVGTNANGYVGAEFDGKYIYFAPQENQFGYHGEVLRYDTTSDFSSSNSWSTFDASANGVGTNAKGYAGAEFDGKYIYFSPMKINGKPHGEVLRYDTTSDFSSSNSWSTFDASANGVGTNANGYVGAEFDGKYIYFAPFHNGAGRHGEVLRYDTTSDFSSPNSWSTFDASANGVGGKPVGYWGLIAIDNEIYFSPFFRDLSPEYRVGHHGEVLRYDAGLP